MCGIIAASLDEEKQKGRCGWQGPFLSRCTVQCKGLLGEEFILAGMARFGAAVQQQVGKQGGAVVVVVGVTVPEQKALVRNQRAIAGEAGVALPVEEGAAVSIP
jgi:hypothetical protein